MNNFTSIDEKSNLSFANTKETKSSAKVKLVAFNLLFFTAITLFNSKNNYEDSFAQSNDTSLSVNMTSLNNSNSKLNPITILPINLSATAGNNQNLLSTILVPENKEITIELKLNPYAEHNTMSSQFRAKNIDESSLKNYLQNRNSILAEEPYFSTIINMAMSYDINPLFLFAITGQEQSFVPTSSSNYSKIANNPFNVHGSWKNYNTSIDDSANIVCKTLINLSKNKPSNYDTIEWINRKYATDTSWASNVSNILNMLEKIAG
jgi:hypothetical protein